jgi:hypothetical protein
MHIKEVEDHKRNILAQIALCQHQLNISQDGRWIDRQIELEKVLATIDQTLVLEYGMQKLWELLKLKVIDAVAQQILDSEQGG